MSETKTSSIITMGTTTAATSVVVEIPLEGGGGGVTTTWSAIKVKCEFLNKRNTWKTACRGSAFVQR